MGTGGNGSTVCAVGLPADRDRAGQDLRLQTPESDKFAEVLARPIVRKRTSF